MADIVGRLPGFSSFCRLLLSTVPNINERCLTTSPICLQKYNFPDTVIWNPWLEKAKEIADFGDDEYPNMICVESGHVSQPVPLMPGTAFEASQILQVM